MEKMANKAAIGRPHGFTVCCFSIKIKGDAIGRPHGFTVCCFSIKIKGASVGWSRPVTVIDTSD